MAGRNGSPAHIECGNGHIGMAGIFGWAWSDCLRAQWPNPPWQARHTKPLQPALPWPTLPVLLLLSHRLCVTFYFPCQLGRLENCAPHLKRSALKSADRFVSRFAFFT